MSFTVRFWSKVERGEGCWLWLAATNKHGYGLFGVAGRSTLAHRVSYQLANGQIPAGKVVIHACDTPACVNPAHLTAATQSDNVRDMVAKGRVSRGAARSALLRRIAPRGERHWRSRLTNEAIAQIRSESANGVTNKVLAARYDVDPSTVSLVVNGRTWSCLSQ